MLFERELPLEGVDDALDPLPDRAQGAVASRLILADRGGAEWPPIAKRSQRCSEGQASRTWATARQTSSESESLGLRPGRRAGRPSRSSMVT